MKLAALALTSSLLLGIGSAVAQPPPPPGPPGPRVEVIPTAPGARYVWAPGHWRWNGVRYIWVGGRYIERRPGWGHWVDGHWAWRPRFGRWEWEPGRWVP